MVPMLRPLAAIAIMCLCTTSGRTQSPTDALNGLFAGSVRFRIDDQDRVVIDFLDRGGRYRQDQAPLAHIDPATIRFDPEQDALLMGCRTGHERCFTKEVFRLSAIRSTSWIQLPRPPEDPAGAATAEALRALLGWDAAAMEPRETPEVPQRMK